MREEENERLTRYAGEVLDHIMTCDVRLNFETEKVSPALYKCAKEATNESLQNSLTMTAAKKIVEKVSPGDICFILTGWKAPYRLYGETDGHLGAVVLARAIAKACKAIPVLLAEDDVANSLIPLCRIAGLNVLDLKNAKATGSSVYIKGMPIGKKKSKEASENIFNELNPSCVISVERPAMNKKGVSHHNAGTSCSEDGIAYLDYIFKEAWQKGVLTIGIGDYGNELGLGKLQDTVKKYIKYGSMCLCPCQGGIAASDPAEVTVFSSTSNWGAFGIAAALAILKGDLNIFHSGKIECEMLKYCVVNGVIDAAYDYPSPTVDTISEEADFGIVELMRTVIRKTLRVK